MYNVSLFLTILLEIRVHLYKVKSLLYENIYIRHIIYRQYSIKPFSKEIDNRIIVTIIMYGQTRSVVYIYFLLRIASIITFFFNNF